MTSLPASSGSPCTSIAVLFSQACLYVGCLHIGAIEQVEMLQFVAQQLTPGNTHSFTLYILASL